VPNNIHV